MRPVRSVFAALRPSRFAASGNCSGCFETFGLEALNHRAADDITENIGRCSEHVEECVDGEDERDVVDRQVYRGRDEHHRHETGVGNRGGSHRREHGGDEDEENADAGGGRRDIVDAAETAELELGYLSTINEKLSAVADERHYVLGNHCVYSLTKEEFEQLNATGRRMIECLDREWTEKSILNVSKAFSVNLAGASKPLIGEIDLIIKDKAGEIVLVDWKTAARKWPETKKSKDLQATCFCYAMKQLTGLDHGFRYDVITKAKEPSYTQHCTSRTDDDYARLSQLVRVVETAVANEVFLPNEQGFYCGGCQYASACKEWHRKQARTISVPVQKAA